MYTFPPPVPQKGNRLVSVLDLEQYRTWGRTPGNPLLGITSDTDVFSLYDVNSVLHRTTGSIKRCAL
jgi:hypothetical protein